MIQHNDQLRQEGFSERRLPDSEAEARGSHLPEAEAPDMLSRTLQHLSVIGENMRVLLELRARRRQMQVRRWIVRGIVVLLAAIALVPLILQGVDMLVKGMAEGFTLFWDGRTWMGNLTASAVILGGIALLVAATSMHMSRRAIKKGIRHGQVEI